LFLRAQRNRHLTRFIHRDFGRGFFMGLPFYSVSLAVSLPSIASTHFPIVVDGMTSAIPSVPVFLGGGVISTQSRWIFKHAQREDIHCYQNYAEWFPDFLRVNSRRVLMRQGFVVQGSGGQVVHLPDSAALPGDVKWVDVIAIGRARIISPSGESWDSWFDGEGVSADFMPEREQRSTYYREPL